MFKDNTHITLEELWASFEYGHSIKNEKEREEWMNEAIEQSVNRITSNVIDILKNKYQLAYKYKCSVRELFLK